MSAILTWLLVLLIAGYAAYRIRRIIRLISLGKKDNRFDQPKIRLGMMFRQSILQLAHFRSNVFDYRFAGLIHLVVFFGFIILLPGEAEFLLAGLIPGFDFSFLPAPLFKLFLISQDIFILLVIVAIVLMLFRRLVLRPRQISYHFTAYLILGWILVLMLTLLFMNAFRLYSSTHHHFAEATAFLPLSIAFSKLTGITAFSHIGYQVSYWIHLLALLSFIAFILNSKHAHVLAAIPANFFRHLGPPFIKLSDIDFEDETIENLGVSQFEDFSWKRIFDGFACTECGRCEDRCPANRTGKPLSPKEIVLTIKRNAVMNSSVASSQSEETAEENGRVDLISEGFIEEEALWCCTTCGACTDVCPVGNEHLPDILEMRRHLIMDQGTAPEIMSRAVKSLETRGHPFYGSAFGPDDWKEGLDVPLYESGETEYLLWLGCAVVYEERSQEIARAMVKLLDKAGVSYGILEDFRCTGDPAKQMGNEFLFQEIAFQNIEEFDEIGIKKIITLCPHCFNSFKHHYAEFEVEYEVIPHSTLIHELIETGRLSLSNSPTTISYHDPCYLARHNGVTDLPRAIVDKVGKRVEMNNSGFNGHCCGAGGGNYWAEETGERINQTRAKEAFDTKADTVATACPFCLLMLTDGMNNLTEDEMVRDIAEIVVDQMEK